MISYIDTHCHLDGEEFAADRHQVVERARAAGAEAIFIPAIDLKSCHSVLSTCAQYPGYCYPMLGLHPEEVRSDWRSQLSSIRPLLSPSSKTSSKTSSGMNISPSSFLLSPSSKNPSSDISHSTFHIPHSTPSTPLSIGEVGLDFYWSREFEQEQLLAFEEQVRWSIETRLPLMIHCRKAQNELVNILKRYKGELPGGVFHCFTGNEIEARELLQFDNFVLGIGGVLTFKKSHLPEVLPASVPLDRIVLETDAPYMAPVPHRGQRNEPAFVREVISKLAEAYGVTDEEVASITTANAKRVFFC